VTPLVSSWKSCHRSVLLVRADIGIYLGVKALYRRWANWWVTPPAMTPLVLMLVAIVLHTNLATTIIFAERTGWSLCSDRQLSPSLCRSTSNDG
jgi:hypothetical protein